MFCPKCGIEAGSARFCRSCGMSLAVVSNVLEGGGHSGRHTAAVGGGTTLNLFHSSRLSNDRDLNGHTAVSVFGGTRLDLTARPLALGETGINVISVFGGAEIIVPGDVAIRITGISIFGGIEMPKRGGGGIFSVNRYETPGYAQSPRRLHIDVTSVFGGAKIRRSWVNSAQSDF